MTDEMQFSGSTITRYTQLYHLLLFSGEDRATSGLDAKVRGPTKMERKRQPRIGTNMHEDICKRKQKRTNGTESIPE